MQVWTEKPSPRKFMTKQWRFVVVWEFRVRLEALTRFLQVYGAEGDWARLFAQSDDYIKTDLVRDPEDPLLFRTLDFWTSENAYDHFRQQHATQYKGIDQHCESMTETEVEIGRFDREAFQNWSGSSGI